MQPRPTLFLLTFALGIYLVAITPHAAWAQGFGGGSGAGGGGHGAGASTAGGAGGRGSGAIGGGGRSPGRTGFGGYGGHHGRGSGFGSRYGRPGTFTGYGDPYGEHQNYAPRLMDSGLTPTGDQVRVVDLQRALKSRGYYRGTVNGRFGPRSIEALERFRRDQGIAPADYLDRSTVEALRLGRS